MRREPVLTASVLSGLILSLLAFLAQRGYISWTADDASALAEFLSYAAPLVIVVVAGIVARYNVTPLADPKDVDGEPLTRSDNSPAKKARK